MSYSGWYLFFIVLLMFTVVEPVLNMENRGVVYDGDVNFDWYHYCLSLYALSNLWHDYLIFMSLKSAKEFVSFWRMYSLNLHVSLFVSLLLRFVMAFAFPCEYEPALQVKTCTEDYLDVRKVLDDVSSSLMAGSVIETLLGLSYWLQLNHKTGNLVINLSRVIMDILPMNLIFNVMLFSWAFGFTALLCYFDVVPLQDYFDALNATAADFNSTTLNESISNGEWMANTNMTSDDVDGVEDCSHRVRDRVAKIVQYRGRRKKLTLFLNLSIQKYETRNNDKVDST